MNSHVCDAREIHSSTDFLGTVYTCILCGYQTANERRALQHEADLAAILAGAEGIVR
jgi:hypothetical protein